MQMLETMIPRLNDLFERGFYFQRDGAPAHFKVNSLNPRKERLSVNCACVSSATSNDCYQVAFNKVQHQQETARSKLIAIILTCKGKTHVGRDTICACYRVLAN
ncbi:hypothetical protein ANN_00911 [Periplaneta americana]|uniref:Uncharacterized protein n=1 Tax=Periplaneta americana TaxID=6978 RepID=A0ABQ8TTT2_PERAM|nr:hypothetical protein ANN_00911 [Periplaneta americana]